MSPNVAELVAALSELEGDEGSARAGPAGAMPWPT